MADWLAANVKLRADRDAMDAVKRREAEDLRAEGAAAAPEDCICTLGTSCRHNRACPRHAARAGAAR